MGTYDFVIVGGGSAGSALANRLSADPGARVLVLVADDEADAGSWRVWDAYAVSPDGALLEPALGFARGAPLAQVFAGM